MPISFAPKVIADDSLEWCGNSLRFATEHEAQSYVQNLASRWRAVRASKVDLTQDPVTHYWDARDAQALPVSEVVH